MNNINVMHVLRAPPLILDIVFIIINILPLNVSLTAHGGLYDLNAFVRCIYVLCIFLFHSFYTIHTLCLLIELFHLYSVDMSVVNVRLKLVLSEINKKLLKAFSFFVSDDEKRTVPTFDPYRYCG